MIFAGINSYPPFLWEDSKRERDGNTYKNEEEDQLQRKLSKEIGWHVAKVLNEK